MITDLKHYIFVVKNFYDRRIMQSTIMQLKNIKWDHHKFISANGQQSAARSGENELSISWSDDIKTKDDMQTQLWQVIDMYQKRLDFTWWSTWQGYSDMRFNKYEVNQKMALHKDHIHSLFDGKRKGIPILSILIALNDDYEGGDFVMLDDYRIKLRQGDVLIFPSNFLFPHKVEPVKFGTRYTAISWTW